MKSRRELNVLVVDDNVSDLTMLKAFLKEMGFRRISEARDGSQAHFKVENEPFDLVITDWKMPVLTGLAFLQKIRHDVRFKKIPVIFLTGISDRAEVETAIKDGVTDYLIKPLRKPAFVEKVSKLFPIKPLVKPAL